jgi:tetratricopeptide (TPR) repeat protein
MGDVDGAIAEFREAIRIDPKDAKVHYNLGLLLRVKGDVKGVIAELQEAVRLDPGHSAAYQNLGNALMMKGDAVGAIASYKEALRLDPKNSNVHYNLGNAFGITGQLDDAIVEFREALRLEPRFPLAHYNLGNALGDKGDVDGAIAEYKEALRLDPRFSPAHFDLGSMLQRKGDLDGAVTEFKEALRLDPKNRFALSRLPGAERMRELVLRLPDVLAGRAELKSPAETLELASVCALPMQRHHLAAIRLYEKAVAVDPKLAENLVAGHRYNAACSAALAAAGQDAEMPVFGVDEWGFLTDLAHGWLRADLAGWAERAKDPKNGAAVRRTLTHWKQDANLIAIRDRAWLAAMPSTDRKRWEAFWMDVDALLVATAP